MNYYLAIACINTDVIKVGCMGDVLTVLICFLTCPETEVKGSQSSMLSSGKGQHSDSSGQWVKIFF